MHNELDVCEREAHTSSSFDAARYEEEAHFYVMGRCSCLLQV